jgi:hypothetical protein
MEREASLRELTEEEIKTVSGGTQPGSQPNPGWSNQGGLDGILENPPPGFVYSPPGNSNQTWREGTVPGSNPPVYREKQPT